MAQLRSVITLVLVAFALSVAAPVFGASSNGSSTKTAHTKKSKKKDSTTGTGGSGDSHKSKSETSGRDSHGRIKRSEEAKHRFEVQTGYPHGRPGYVVDHIKPLACGGADVPSNMQWQTVAAAKAKDRVERAGCR